MRTVQTRGHQARGSTRSIFIQQRTRGKEKMNDERNFYLLVVAVVVFGFFLLKFLGDYPIICFMILFGCLCQLWSSYFKAFIQKTRAEVAQ
jgi:hypothetical protein